MGRKRNRNKGEAGGNGAAGGGGGGGGEKRMEKGNNDSNWGGEHLQQAAVPLIALDPTGDTVAVAFGTHFKVFNTR
jgi:hypothetical protein